MASIFKRRNKAGQLSPRWSYRWTDDLGVRRSGTGSTDKAATLRLAQKLETEAALVRGGVLDRREHAASAAANVPISQHVQDYLGTLRNIGNTEKHCRHQAGAVQRLLMASGAQRLPEIAQETFCGALRRLKDKSSSRTANHALGATKAFLRWCENTERIREFPAWLRGVKAYNERVDRRRVRRALSKDEFRRLIKTTCCSQALWRGITGIERSDVYQFACITGLRANEIRSLTEQDFRLDGDDPHVIVRAAYSKHRREDRQPIRRDEVGWCKQLLDRRRDKPLFRVPEKTAAMLRYDLAKAGIPYETPDGVIDFHSLRATYITLLAQAGVDPKSLQKLARHSTITLTLDRYCKTTDQGIRKALESSHSNETSTGGTK